VNAESDSKTEDSQYFTGNSEADTEGNYIINLALIEWNNLILQSEV